MKFKKDWKRPDTALIYIRVSSEEQVKGSSLQTQDKLGREYCSKNGWKLLELFREEGESAKTADRTELIRMKDYCIHNPGKVGYIVVWKVDRFARSSRDHFELRTFFSSLGIELRSVSENIEDTSSGRAVEGILAVMAQLENDIKKDRTLTGMRSRAEGGYWPTGAPWGYKNTKDALGKKIIVPDEERAHIVKFLFEEYSRGTYTFLELAKRANEMWNVRSKRGTKIDHRRVCKILKNPIHSGWIEVQKFDVSLRGHHEAIVSRELYNEVQKIMLGGKSRKQPRNQSNPDFPLRGVKCDGCGGSITGGWILGKMKKPYAYYNCHNCECPKKKCIRKIDLEADFTEFLSENTPDSKVLDALAEAITVVHERTAQESIRETSKIENRLEKLERDLSELLRMRVRGEIDSDEYLRQSDLWKVEVREIEERRASLMNPETITKAAVEFGMRIIKEFPTCWPMLEVGELKALLQILFPQNLRYQYPKFKTPELSPIYAVETSKTTDENHHVTLPGVEPGFRA